MPQKLDHLMEPSDSITSTVEQNSLNSACVNEKGVIVIGISGGSGSGKTMLSSVVCDSLGKENVVHICHDSYYRSSSAISQEQINHDHPSSLETNLMAGREVDIPVYDFVAHSRLSETKRLPPKSIVLIEGFMIFNDQALCDLCDIKVWVDTPSDIRFIRRLQRDVASRGRTVESVINQYLTTTRPMYELYARALRNKADIVVLDSINTVVLDMIVSKLKPFIPSMSIVDS